MDALMMRGVIVTAMMMVLMFTRRHLRIAQYECEVSVHRRQHEPCGYERSQE
jgi:hypothetical protein